MQNKSQGIYRFIAPFYDSMDYLFEKAYYQYMRAKWMGSLKEERILEIGVGTGKNLPYYHRSNSVLAFDRNPQMLSRAQKRLQQHKDIRSQVELALIDTIPWPFASNSFSIGVATFVFCTMANPSKTLQEISRVIQAKGKLILFEWVLPQKGVYRFFLRFFSPITHFFFGVNFYRYPSHHYLNNKWQVLKLTRITPYLVVTEIQKK